mmetsp:Transcript_2091/g.4843  ORF Transcript_2091/g.4843 Transcript_2091/m.4843 type:complete len:696 (-) Transcript_2091:85-2172(-)
MDSDTTSSKKKNAEKKHQSPLTSFSSSSSKMTQQQQQSKKQKKRSRHEERQQKQQELEDDEEALLTAQLFGVGGDGGSSVGGVASTTKTTAAAARKHQRSGSSSNRKNYAVVAEQEDEQEYLQDNVKTNHDDLDDGGLLFEIDRSGGGPNDDDDDDQEEGEVVDADSGPGQQYMISGRDHQHDDGDSDDDEDEDSDDDDDDDDGAQDDVPAWDDPDEDDDDDDDVSQGGSKRRRKKKKQRSSPAAKIRLVDASDRLKKLRKSRKEKTELTTQELEQRLRQRYEVTAQTTARTDWAASAPLSMKDDDGEIGGTKKSHDDEDDGQLLTSTDLFSTSESLFADHPGYLKAGGGTTGGGRLPPNVLDIVRCPDANQADPNRAVVQAVNFHPGSDPDQPLLLTAGLDKTLRFFQVGEKQSEKIHGIHFQKMPIYSANFLGDTGKVVVSGRRPFFYLYDAVSGNVDLVPRILGRDERSWERHTVSPDGRLIAFVGNDGYIVLVDAHSKHSVGTLKLNGSVRSITFTPDGSNIIASGSDGDVYRWDVKSRRCIERFPNQDGTVTSCLAASSTRLAVGAESGVVNLYSEHQDSFQSSFYGGGSRQKSGITSKDPLKSIMNLQTSNDALKFNSDGQILALSSRREQHGLKLFHVPSQTVFSNWPTMKTPLRYVWSLDFSPQSKFLAIGNDKGKCLLYKLKHYDS